MLTLLAGSAGTPAAVVSAGAYRALLARFRATGTLSKRSQRMEVAGVFFVRCKTGPIGKRERESCGDNSSAVE